MRDFLAKMLRSDYSGVQDLANYDILFSCELLSSALRIASEMNDRARDVQVARSDSKHDREPGESERKRNQ